MMAQASSTAATKAKPAASRDAGYSGTPLATKLGLKDGQEVVFIGLPASLGELAQARSFARVSLLEEAADSRLPRGSVDLMHAFFTDAAALRDTLPSLRAAIRDSGAIWISWPKKTAKGRAAQRSSDLSDEVVQRAALAINLVDVKVCAVDAVWSGLKLVIPRAERAPKHTS
jgi:hypothetical protein